MTDNTPRTLTITVSISDREPVYVRTVIVAGSVIPIGRWVHHGDTLKFPIEPSKAVS